jgi:hypothetical protein
MGVDFLFDGLQLLNEDHVEALLKQMREKYGTTQTGLVIVDTLAQAAAGLQENGSEMAALAAVGQLMAVRLGWAFEWVHHSGHDNQHRMRGWSGLPAAMDFHMCVSPPEGGKGFHTVTLTKSKDDETGTAYSFSLLRLELEGCLDVDGKPEFSMVVQPAAQFGSSAMAKQLNRTALNESDDAMVLAWVKELVADGAQPSKSYLEGKRDERFPGKARDWLRDALARLQGDGMLMPEGTGSKAWWRPCDGK